MATTKASFGVIDDVIDDDTMATASATTLATSESIKAYVDGLVAAVPTSPVKAWVKFSVAATVVTVNASSNITSVVRNSAGDFTVTMTNALADANYVVNGNVKYVGTVALVVVKDGSTPTTTTFTILTKQYNGVTADPTDVYISVIGN